ncbi:MAG: glycosyltransferase, partial [Granulosicoccaceae bacterium]
MRILFLVDGYFPGVGGAEIQAQLLAKTLIGRGHDVQVVAPHLLPELPLEESHHGVPIKRIGYPHIPKLSNIFYMINFARFYLKHAREYDAVHIHMVHKMASVVALLRNWVDRPVIAKVSGATEFEGGVLDFRHDRFYTRWLRKLLMRIDYYQSLSSFSTAKIRQAGASAEQVVTLANGLDISRFQLSHTLHQLGDDRGEFVFAYCGR